MIIRPAGAPEDGSQDVACTDGCTVHQGDTARLQVSLGPLPNVAGESEGKARSTLEGLGLIVADPSQTESSDSVKADRVIRVIGKDDGTWLAPGDTVTLVVSTGPALFEVPDFEGMTLAEARQAATDAGFSIDYDERWDAFPDPFTQVESQKPDAGDMQPKGTVISLRIAAAL